MSQWLVSRMNGRVMAANVVLQIFGTYIGHPAEPARERQHPCITSYAVPAALQLLLPNSRFDL